MKSPTTRHHPHPNEGEYAVKTHTHIYWKYEKYRRMKNGHMRFIHVSTSKTFTLITMSKSVTGSKYFPNNNGDKYVPDVYFYVLK